MPKHPKRHAARPVPIRPPLFTDVASLIRVRPERNEWRFYRMEVWPDLFGRALLLRQWGRIGTEGRRRLDPHSDPGAAINALARLAGRKRRLDMPRRTRETHHARSCPDVRSGSVAPLVGPPSYPK